jgi:hypothetical protein
LGACWSPTRWLGEGSTVTANAERVKDAAEAYHYGYPQRGGRDGRTVAAAPNGVFSILGRVQGRSQGHRFAAWQEPDLFTTEVRAAFRSLR